MQNDMEPGSEPGRFRQRYLELEALEFESSRAYRFGSTVVLGVTLNPKTGFGAQGFWGLSGLPSGSFRVI